MDSLAPYQLPMEAFMLYIGSHRTYFAYKTQQGTSMSLVKDLLLPRLLLWILLPHNTCPNRPYILYIEYNRAYLVCVLL